nr:DUF4215 domain-containing protein [Gammaproteobacteria bacterium]
MRITISPKWPIVLLASALLLACDARPRTSSGVSQDLDTLSTYCGDGVLALGIETCDDGNTVDNDDCTNLCRSPNSSDTLIDLARAAFKAGPIGFCGDGIRNGFESCDDGNLDDTDHCSSSCRLNSSGTPSWYVRDDSTLGLPYCGDGLVNQASEDCDDGNGDDTDHCTNRCLIQDPVDQPNSIVSTNNNQNQQEDDPCFAIQTELGLPTEWCD